MKTRSAHEDGGNSTLTPRLPQSNFSPTVLWRVPLLSSLPARDDDGANARFQRFFRVLLRIASLLPRDMALIDTIAGEMTQIRKYLFEHCKRKGLRLLDG